MTNPDPPAYWIYDSKGRLVGPTKPTPPEAKLPLIPPGAPVPWRSVWLSTPYIGVAMGLVNLFQVMIDQRISYVAPLALYYWLTKWHPARVRHRWWAAGCGLLAVLIATGLLVILLPPSIPDSIAGNAAALVGPIVYAVITHLPRRQAPTLD